MRILIIDDNINSRALLKGILTKELSEESPEILEAGSVDKALETVSKSTDIDVIIILLDVILDQERSLSQRGAKLLQSIPSSADRPRVIIRADPELIPAQKQRETNSPVDFFFITDADPRPIAQVARIMAQGRKNVLRYGEEDLFGSLFCEELDDKCKLLRNDGSALDTMTENMINLVQSSALTFLNSRGRSSEELFQYIAAFNGVAGALVHLPERFMDLIWKLPDVERALYRIPEYRDHLIHQMQVFLLGFCVLAQMKQRLENVDIRSKLGLDDGSWLRQWFLASAFHDIGYPFEKMHQWLNLFFRDMLSPGKLPSEESNIPCMFNWGAFLGWDDHLDNFNHLMERISRTFDAGDNEKMAIYRGMFRGITIAPNHAPMSALILLSLVEIESALDAAVAVSLHDTDMAEMVKEALGCRLSFQKAPLACILAFCDAAQEWGRVKPWPTPRITYKFGTPRFLSLLFDKDKGVRLELIYPSQFSLQMKASWRDEVSNGILKEVSNCWHAEERLHITYYHEAEYEGGKHPELGSLII